ncbi:MAG: hypothetical protein OXB88_07685 [Bacteriovoracales bacterium]|nr:hypothetical protein [Bacteriovoracales bacterium]
MATAAQVGRDIYRGVTKTVIYRRLKKLLSMKYLSRGFHFDGQRAVSVYSLSKRGLGKFIFDKGTDGIVKQAMSNSVEHDLILNDIRHLFMQKGQVKDYLTENTMAALGYFRSKGIFETSKKIRSDATVLWEKNDQTYRMALEYEHSLKYRHRYNLLFGSYYLEYDIDGVFYICRDKKILKKVCEVEKRHHRGKRGKVFFTTLDELFSGRKALSFTSSVGGWSITVS